MHTYIYIYTRVYLSLSVYERIHGLCFSTQKQLFVFTLAAFLWYPSLEHMNNLAPCLSSFSAPRRRRALYFPFLTHEACHEKLVTLFLID